jgi:hypothetical protein
MMAEFCYHRLPCDRISVCCLMLDIELHQLLTTEVCYCRWSMPYALS